MSNETDATPPAGASGADFVVRDRRRGRDRPQATTNTGDNAGTQGSVDATTTGNVTTAQDELSPGAAAMAAKETVPEASASASAAPESAAGASARPTADPAGASESDLAPEADGTENAPGMTASGFIQFAVVTLAQQAWQDLGLVPNAASGKIEPNLDEARLGIDAFAALLPVLQPRLEEGGRRELQTALSNLRLNFVHQANRQNARSE